MQSVPAYGYYYAASEYVSQYNGGNPICANDMALPFGGKFDIQDSWASPRVSHDRGSAVDTAVTTTNCGSANVVTNGNAMVQACINHQELAANSYYLAGVAVHCNWDNPSSYPH